jgi:hypothetical protein
MTVSDLFEQPCMNKSDNIMQQGCYKLLTACSKLVDNLGKQCEHNLLTACWHPDLLQDVRFLQGYEDLDLGGRRYL